MENILLSPLDGKIFQDAKIELKLKGENFTSENYVQSLISFRSWEKFFFHQLEMFRSLQLEKKSRSARQQ